MYTGREQRARESAYDRALSDVQRLARPAARLNATQAEQRILAAFARFAAEALDLGPDAIDLLTHDFLPVGTCLARWARSFDPGLSDAGIVQACRNAWTACGLQPLVGERMCLTPAILAYSLLYPYSDNYLDARLVTRAEKFAFNQRFRCRLQGERLVAATHHEVCVWRMVELIELEFDRVRYPQVYDSLLAIHAAQASSVAQLEQCGSMSEDELLRISCAKGGTSVLADAALVLGAMSEDHADFAFAWGVLLQLGDDLQDVREDLRRGSDTLFTRAVRKGGLLDELVAQLLNFSGLVGARMDSLGNGSATHRALLRMSWRSLILMAVAEAQEFFSTAFLRELEPRSPFQFEFLRSRREKLQGRSGLLQRLFDILLHSESSSGASMLPDPTRHPSSLPSIAVLLSGPAGRVEGSAVAFHHAQLQNDSATDVL